MSDRLGAPASEALIHPVPSQFAQSLSIRIESESSTSEPLGAIADQAWTHMCAQNPKLFDGPILAATRLSLEEGIIWCARNSYRKLALRDELGLDIAILSVTTILQANDKAGRTHVLLGQRGRQTRSYPGLWEFGPAGGLDAPPDDCKALNYQDVLRQVNLELREETGIRAQVHDGQIIAVVFDPLAGSYDIVFRTMLDQPIEQFARLDADQPWEYEQTKWVPWSSISQFAKTERERLIGPTRSLIHWLDESPT